MTMVRLVASHLTRPRCGLGERTSLRYSMVQSKEVHCALPLTGKHIATHELQ